MTTIIIPNYIREIQLSAARQVKYYKIGKKLPKAKKYHDKTKYDFRTIEGLDEQWLFDLSTNQRVIANPKAAGTPKVIVINGQKIYNGEVNKHIRNKVLSSIKSSFKSYVEQLEPITKFPIKLSLEIHDTIRESNSHNLWDMDNRAWPYIKAFQDVLTGNKDKTGKFRNKVVIPDDNILYITQPPVPKFIPIDNEDDRMLIFKIEEEDDKRILDHKGYKEELLKLKK